MELLIILFLIVLNGVFSMAEIATVSARKSKLDLAAKRGDKSAKLVIETLNSPNKFLSTVQIGITLIGILTGIFSGEKMTEDIKGFYHGFASLKPYAHFLAVTTVVVIITFFCFRRIGSETNRFDKPGRNCQNDGTSDADYFQDHGSVCLVIDCYFGHSSENTSHQTIFRRKSNGRGN